MDEFFRLLSVDHRRQHRSLLPDLRIPVKPHISYTKTTIRWASDLAKSVGNVLLECTVLDRTFTVSAPIGVNTCRRQLL